MNGSTVGKFTLLGVLSVAAAGCVFDFGPSEAQRACYAECARGKDRCILDAAKAEQIQTCDQRSKDCSLQCEAP